MTPERISRKVVFEGPRLNLYLDKVKLPGGRVVEDFHVLEFTRPSVITLMEDADGRLILGRIWRYTTGDTQWELPAGRIEVGESEIQASAREAREEAGYSSAGHRLIYSYYPVAGIANLTFHVVHCRAVAKVGEFDPEEVSETRWFKRDELVQMIKDRAVRDGFTLTALLLWLPG